MNRRAQVVDEAGPRQLGAACATAEGRLGVNYYFNLGSVQKQTPDLPVRSKTKGK